MQNRPSPLGRPDIPYAFLVLISFLAALWASWQRWGNPLIDAGREMNVPLRLAHGEMLYSQVRYIYGPLSPYLTAMRYRFFGVHLWVLCANGIETALLILVLVYWLARKLMEPPDSVVACLAVTWLCAFKPEGNYVLPYAYSALHGCALDLLVLVSLLCFLNSRRSWWLLAAGVCAGLAGLAKTESGIIAIGTGAAALILVYSRQAKNLLKTSLVFLLPALGLPAAVYAWFARQVGWETLTQRSFLFFGHVPWQLIHFNEVRFGFDRPVHSIFLMLLSLLRLGAIAGVLAAVCLWIPDSAEKTSKRHSWIVLVSSLALIAATSLGLGDLGPLLPMPIVLLAMLAIGVRDYLRNWRKTEGPDPRIVQLMLFVVFSLLSLGRIFLRVSTGGALSSDLIPTTMILFVYCWTVLFPRILRSSRRTKLARELAMVLLFIAVAASAVTLSIRYRKKFTYVLLAPHGTMRTQPDLGRGFAEAARFLQSRAPAGAYVAVAPEGTSLDFLWGWKNPLSDEILVPGMLDANGEARAIADLERTHTRFFLVTNRSTHEFGQTSFGEDYDTTLMNWVRAHFRVCAFFGDAPANARVGDSRFFIRVYCRD